MSHIQQFADAIRAAGLHVPDKIHDDGAIHRFSTNGKPGDKSGWYVLHGDGVPAGQFGCFRAGLDATFRADIGRTLTDRELREQQQRMEESRKQRDAILVAERESARVTALDMWERAGKPNGHGYLKRKKVQPHGVKELDGMVLVPVYDASKKIVGLQRIYEDGQKFFLRGTQAAGSYMSIGKATDRMVICEGWATGASIHEATGRTVVVAFNAGNLPAVAGLMRQRYPKADIVIAADNDQFTEGNPGIEAGWKAGDAIGARVVFPVFQDISSKPTDFNDLHVLDGLDAVRAAFDLHPMSEPEPQVPAPIPPAAGIGLWDQLGLAVTDKGALLQNLDNVVRAIEADPSIRGSIWYDEFLDAVVTTWQGPQRQWKDADDVKLQLYMQRYIGLTKIGVQTCHDAALVAAFHDTRNECRAWMHGLQWDGVPRLAYLMSEGFGTEQTAYTEAVGRCWMISMVARVTKPGCKVDTVPVLEGGQGVGKSTGLSILGGKWFVEAHEPATSKDFFGVLQGHMLVEISEMHSFTRAEVERIKGVISCQKDRYRKAYGRNTEDHDRQTVLVCTTNRDDWQKDDTGARRFWPVRCGKVDLDWLRLNREQLFAEAVALYRDGTPWWDVPSEQQRDEVEARRDVDSWEPVVEGWLDGRVRFQMHDLLSECLKIEIGRHDQMVQKRVGRILRVLGWERRTTREHGRVVKAWVRVT